MLNPINQRIDELVIDHTKGNNSQFAKLVGTSEAKIRNYRNPKKNTMPKLDVLISISQKLKIRLDWLVTGTGPKDEDIDMLFVYDAINQIKTLNSEIESLLKSILSSKNNPILRSAAEDRESYELKEKKKYGQRKKPSNDS